MATAYINDDLGNHQIDDWIGGSWVSEWVREKESERKRARYSQHYSALNMQNILNFPKRWSKEAATHNYEVPVS